MGIYTDCFDCQRSCRGQTVFSGNALIYRNGGISGVYEVINEIDEFCKILH